MSSTPYERPTDPVVPAGVNAASALTVGELGAIGAAVKANPMAVLGDQKHPAWPTCLAHVAWTWAKRLDPRAKLQPFLDCTVSELVGLLRLDEDDDVAELDAETNPTDSPAGSWSPAPGDSTPTP